MLKGYIWEWSLSFFDLIDVEKEPKPVKKKVEEEKIIKDTVSSL